MRDRFFYLLVGVSITWFALSLIYDREDPRPDFAHDYVAGLMVRMGRAEMIYSSDPSDMLMSQDVMETMRSRGYDGPYITRFFSHPFYAILLVPLTFLPYHPASAVFLSLQIILLCLLLLAIFRGREPWRIALGLSLFLLFYPIRHGLAIGQATGFLIPVAGYFILRPQRTLSQVGLALGFLIKPVPLLLPLLFLTERRWRGLIVFIGTWFIASVAAILFLGKGPFLQYLSLVLERASLIYVGVENQSSLAFLYRLLVGTSEHAETSTVLVVVPLWLKAIHWAWVVVVLGLAGWRLWKTWDLVWRGNILLLASLLVIPFASSHYFGLALLPLLFLSLSPGRLMSYLLAGAGFLLLEVPRAYYAAGGLALRFLCVNLLLGTILLFLGYMIGPERPSVSSRQPS